MSSIVIAAIVATPWLVAMRLRGAATVFLLALVAAMGMIYFGLPSTAGPLFGGFGKIAAFLLVLSGIAALVFGDIDDRFARSRHRGALSFVPLLGGTGAFALYAFIGIAFIGIGNSVVFRAIDYAALAPHIEQREWSVDLQPKDPRHLRTSSDENATFLAGRAMGQATTLDSRGLPNAIGSQFSVSTAVSSTQVIKGELWTIVPIDWNGWGPQFSGTAGVPGYIKVSGENPIIPAEFVKLPSGKEFHFTPEAIWSKNLQRLVWQRHMSKYIADVHLEIDDEGNPHYIVALAEPTIGWWGEKITGALIVDPVTGNGIDKFYPLGQVPNWVDRVESQHLVHRNIDYHGKYAQGFLNRSIYGSSVMSATETHLGFGSDGDPVWQTGITAKSTTAGSSTANPVSLVAVYYTNTRTGKTTEYIMNGGATETTAVNQCNLLGDVVNKRYHGTTPQIYNIYGHISYVVPLQNASHAFAGVCIVDIMNTQVINWGPSAHEAVLAFKQMIVAAGSRSGIESARTLAEMKGTVARFGTTIVSGSATYLIQLEGTNHLFTIPMSASSKIPVTKIGDQVWVKYFDSKESVLPVSEFDNLSLVLDMSPNEKAVTERAAGHTADLQKANDQRK